VFSVDGRRRVSSVRCYAVLLMLLTVFVVDLAAAATIRRREAAVRVCRPTSRGTERWLHPCGEESFPADARRRSAIHRPPVPRLLRGLEETAQRLVDLANDTVDSYVSPLCTSSSSPTQKSRMLYYTFVSFDFWFYSTIL